MEVASQSGDVLAHRSSSEFDEPPAGNGATEEPDIVESLPLRLETLHGARLAEAPIRNLIIAGWTGRNPQQVEAHIHELEALGIPRPKHTPQFYRVTASLVTGAAEIQVAGCHSTGEAECVLFQLEDSLWVGLGSDHTDRKAERHNVTWAKQLCPKPVAATAWPWAEVEPHWDELLLRAYVAWGNERLLYQEGSVAAILPPFSLIGRYRSDASGNWSPGDCMFCGTLAAVNTISWAADYWLELEDPVLKRRIQHRYRVNPLPIEE